jgi:hypothetical protein
LAFKQACGGFSIGFPGTDWRNTVFVHHAACHEGSAAVHVGLFLASGTFTLRTTRRFPMQMPAIQEETEEVDSSKWYDGFLHCLRLEGDPEADEALDRALQTNEAGGITRLFAVMNSNDEIPPEEQFPVIAEFFRRTGSLPADIDRPRIARGEEVFEKHAYAGALVLLAKSLPEGYQAPNLTAILNISGDLRVHTYRRLLGTLQTVINVSSGHGFAPGGRAVITAQKLRLLHAGIRRLTYRYRPEFAPRYGVPVNQEDMLATVLGFSLLVIEGWRTLNVGLTMQEEEDFLYVWLVFARMMGVHPPGEPADSSYLPANVQEASEFYRRYERRHYVDGVANPDGVALAAANLNMLHSLILWPLRLLGFGVVPRLCMTKLMGYEACARLRIKPVRFHPFLKFLLVNMHRILHPLGRGHGADHERLGMMLFQDLIKAAYGAPVSFTVPTDLQQMRDMVGTPATRNPGPAIPKP